MPWKPYELAYICGQTFHANPIELVELVSYAICCVIDISYAICYFTDIYAIH